LRGFADADQTVGFFGFDVSMDTWHVYGP
jgi:hypothetical protein